MALECSTDTVHMALPPGSDLQVACAMCRCFGDAASIDLIPGTASAVSVVFFDVRAAARAVEALGSTACKTAPPSGNRLLRLPGNLQLDATDFPKIAGIHSDRDGSFIVEFFDLRDALQFSGGVAQVPVISTESPEAVQNVTDGARIGSFVELPPGLLDEPMLRKGSKRSQLLERPPGLDYSQGLEKNATVDFSTEASSSHKVVITGLPNKILCETMMRAVLQQAQVEGSVLSFSTCAGQPCGEASVTLSTRCAAETCVKHFHGRRWDSSGIVICAMIIPTGGGISTGTCSEARSTVLSADSPVFVPTGQLIERAVATMESHVSSMEKGAKTLSPSSDASTEVGESEAEDDKEWQEPAVPS